MKQEDIKELMTFFDEKSSLSKIKIKNDDFEIEIKKFGADIETGTACATPAPHAPAAVPAVNVVVGDSHAASKASMDTIDSPMVGTFYKAASPGANPFVSAGQVVHKGDTIGIIEAMKIMNEVEAEFDCRIIKSLVEDGQPVEYAMSLFEVEKL
ncbi:MULTISPECIES: acetyl-CoA carboxylase biotin carboxyl carrier protein [unclassified Campylobacter]|uniref:acetyl-CoA carboxylase biotin carboxyl carrier protein n=1 Tax=unclassified Campylobacter TaxID=2593542 RepID=UPI0022E9F509|nr:MULTISPECIES: acetyl-CoA carboxylase biotin carboxyl carrier protein [unclassified Campylobacter]MDA3062534.1 acetyl-CoA carboxylase biotin carboxyl carrier protein [Campylobacter sp. JMF_14 EL1]MDA3073791.1 acetyl-CoA carboxylase biotin carboxyl carrier protein [Campylobacter sp. JMF_10 EL2]